jgi:hypothetical protein
VTEVDLNPLFSRMSCSFISSREEEEKTRKRSCGSDSRYSQLRISHLAYLLWSLTTIDILH